MVSGQEIKEAGGYWIIGGIFALLELIVLFALSDVLGMPAWIAGIFWIIVGMWPRYRAHKWWLTRNDH